MRGLILAGASVVGSCGVPGAVLAQSTTGAGDATVAVQSEQAEPTEQAASQGGLAEIIVTAQRRSESAQRAAIAIDVVSGSDVVAGGISNVGQLSTLAPSLTIQQVGPNNASFIRGVGNFSTGVTNDPAVAFNYDGVYIGRQNAIASTFFDLDRIEVLKGPQGTLYGRNATAGVINVIPTRPEIGVFSGFATASYGNYDALAFQGAINVPVGETSAFRLSGTITDRDGYLSDGSADSKTQALRAQFRSEITPGLSVRLAADYTHLGGNGNSPTYLNTYVRNFVTGQFVVTPIGLPLSEGVNSPASQAFYTTLPTGPVGTPGVAGRPRNPFPDLYQDTDLFGVNAEISYDAGFGVLTVIPAARWNHIRVLNPAGGFPIAIDQKDKQFSVEARFAGEIGPIDYTLGAFYFNEDNDFRSGSGTFGNSIAFAAPTGLKTESFAPFARLTANLNDQLRLVGGIRYTHDSKRIDGQTIIVTASCAAGFTCPNIVLPNAVPDPSGLAVALPASGTTIPGSTPNSLLTRPADVFFNSRQTTGKITWRAAVEYDVAPASLLYASVETGFRSGGFNTSVGFETYEPEYITAYTLGSKNRFLDNRIQLNIEAFYWKYRNQQVAHPGIDLVGRANSITENIGNSTIKGIEVDGRFLITPNTVVNSTVAYLDTENTDFTYQVPVFLRPYTACAVTPGATPAVLNVDCAGLPAFNSPKWTLNFGVEQTIPLGDYELVLNADTQYKSKRFVGFEYQPEQLQESSWTSNAQVSFGPTDSRWSVAAFVRNIENDRLFSAVIAFGGLQTGYTTAPRTYGVRASVRF